MSPTTARQQLNPSGDWPISSKLTLDDQVTTASQRTGPCDPHTDIKRPISGGILMFRGSDAKDHTTMLILQGDARQGREGSKRPDADRPAAVLRRRREGAGRLSVAAGLVLTRPQDLPGRGRPAGEGGSIVIYYHVVDSHPPSPSLKTCRRYALGGDPRLRLNIEVNAAGLS
jgi:hypothetical protein